MIFWVDTSFCDDNIFTFEELFVFLLSLFCWYERNIFFCYFKQWLWIRIRISSQRQKTIQTFKVIIKKKTWLNKSQNIIMKSISCKIIIVIIMKSLCGIFINNNENLSWSKVKISCLSDYKNSENEVIETNVNNVENSVLLWFSWYWTSKRK